MTCSLAVSVFEYVFFFVSFTGQIFRIVPPQIELRLLRRYISCTWLLNLVDRCTLVLAKQNCGSGSRWGFCPAVDQRRASLDKTD